MLARIVPPAWCTLQATDREAEIIHYHDAREPMRASLQEEQLLDVSQHLGREPRSPEGVHILVPCVGCAVCLASLSVVGCPLPPSAVDPTATDGMIPGGRCSPRSARRWLFAAECIRSMGCDPITHCLGYSGRQLYDIFGNAFGSSSLTCSHVSAYSLAGACA